MNKKEKQRISMIYNSENFLGNPWELSTNSIGLQIADLDKLLFINDCREVEFEKCCVDLRLFDFKENTKKALRFDSAVNILISDNIRLKEFSHKIYIKNYTTDGESHANILYVLEDIIRKSNIINIPSLIVERDIRFDFVFDNGINVSKDIIYPDN